ncbi:GFA family protein [Tistrella mobilis]|uniref:Glutathione-dependent formaldehyde-activating GFA n=1 Tax=Tistrella mobilis (strain KA081020-065) TaxID=1110502 RepID=I3TUB0_TISMK|nr:GFA family protein [Tistrella mobilis]AFK56348.1 glutathione-dependent formaldehyde-activating GFA [Tistrella mobilis KA081020-065]
MTIRTGQCLCGQVTFAIEGEPMRVGICHCTDCRKESGSAFTYYGVWHPARTNITGESVEYRGQCFCPQCGARLFSKNGTEVEIKLGILSPAPTGLVPGYELWVKRREPWLRPVDGAEQFDENRPVADAGG